MTTSAAMPAGAVFTAEMTGNAVKNNITDANGEGGGFMNELSEKLAKGRSDPENAVSSGHAAALETASDTVHDTDAVSAEQTEQLKRELDEELVKNAALAGKEMAASVRYAAEINEIFKNNVEETTVVGAEIGKVAETDIRQLSVVHSDADVIPESVVQFLGLRSEEFVQLMQSARSDNDAVTDTASLQAVEMSEEDRPNIIESTEMNTAQEITAAQAAEIPSRNENNALTEEFPEKTDADPSVENPQRYSSQHIQTVNEKQAAQNQPSKNTATDALPDETAVKSTENTTVLPDRTQRFVTNDAFDAEKAKNDPMTAPAEKLPDTVWRSTVTDKPIQSADTTETTESAAEAMPAYTLQEGPRAEGEKDTADDIGFEVLENRAAVIESRPSTNNENGTGGYDGNDSDNDSDNGSNSGSAQMFAQQEAHLEKTTVSDKETSGSESDLKVKDRSNSQDTTDTSKALQSSVREQTAISDETPVKAAPEQRVYERKTADEVYSIISENAKASTGRQDFTFRLNPETLGRITVKLINEGGKLSVEIITETKAAKELFQSKESQLAQSLKQSDVEVESYKVEQSSSEMFNESFEGSSKNPYKQRENYEPSENGAESGEFEGIIEEMFKMNQS